MRTLTYTALETDVGRTVLSVLRREMHLSGSLIRRLKYHDGLFLDGRPVHTDVRMTPGQRLEARFAGTEAAGADADGAVNIRYRDEDVLIVEKPAPLPAIASARQSGDSLERRLTGWMGEADYVYRPVNRLDKGTSGLMAVALNPYAQDRLQRALHTDGFVRRYLAVVEGHLPRSEGTVRQPIGRGEGVRRVIDPSGKPSVTHYRVLEETADRSLVMLRLETGRTHQIRVHMQSLGCPVAGDYLYGTPLAALPGRFALHAAFIGFFHPVTGQWLERESPLPPELRALMTLDLR